jgi:uncharacterized protein (TIGR03085 family)
MSLAQSERAQLADLFVTLGPDQPTLCEGWDTEDLLVHLLVRERSVLGAAGNQISALKGFTEKAAAGYARKPWSELIEQYRSGPPALNPTGWGPLDELTNGGEMFVHHEDARRGQVGWEPRVYDAETAAALDKMAGSGLSKMGLRKSTVGVVAELPSRTITLKAGEPVVTVIGDPGELVLWISGRDAVRLEFTGDEAAIETLSKVKRGV